MHTATVTAQTARNMQPLMARGTAAAPATAVPVLRPPVAGEAAFQATRQRIADMLQLLQDTTAPARRIVHAGELVYQAGAAFGTLYILNSGFCKTVHATPDGREQVVGLHMRGDWLGFDGIASGQYSCDAVAMDTGEVWAVPYDVLMARCAERPVLMKVLHEAMSREIARDRDSMMSLCTLPADARVAEFLRHWADGLAQRGLRTDQITLRMTRAEIGNYLGMTLETVSRALSRLAKGELIQFAEKGRREIRIPQVEALGEFVSRSLAPAGTLQ